jgi:hypothetical protein
MNEINSEGKKERKGGEGENGETKKNVLQRLRRR